MKEIILAVLKWLKEQGVDARLMQMYNGGERYLAIALRDVDLVDGEIEQVEREVVHEF